MGGGFTLLPTLLPQAQLGPLKVPHPVLGRGSDRPKKQLNFQTPKNRLRTASRALLGPTWSDFGAQLGLKPPPICSKVGFQVPAYLLIADSHEVL